MYILIQPNAQYLSTKKTDRVYKEHDNIMVLYMPGRIEISNMWNIYREYQNVVVER